MDSLGIFNRTPVRDSYDLSSMESYWGAHSDYPYRRLKDSYMIREEKIEMGLKKLEALELERKKITTQIHEDRMLRDIRDGLLTVVDTRTGMPVSIEIVTI